jgi:hypothetical protein
MWSGEGEGGREGSEGDKRKEGEEGNGGEEGRTGGRKEESEATPRGGKGEAQEGWRFKLYQLDVEGQWDDKGTGFLTIKNDEVRKEGGRGGGREAAEGHRWECQGSTHRLPLPLVQRLGGTAFQASKEDDGSVLLNLRIQPEDIYQRQVGARRGGRARERGGRWCGGRSRGAGRTRGGGRNVPRSHGPTFFFPLPPSLPRALPPSLPGRQHHHVDRAGRARQGPLRHGPLLPGRAGLSAHLVGEGGEGGRGGLEGARGGADQTAWRRVG